MDPTYGVVVSDSAAGGDYGVGGDALDLGVHLNLGPRPAHAFKGKVGGRTVGVDVGEPAGYPPAAAYPVQRFLQRIPYRAVHFVPPVPGDGRFQGFGHQPHAHGGVALVGCVDEGVAPGPHRLGTAGLFAAAVDDSYLVFTYGAAAVAGDGDYLAHLLALGEFRGLKTQHQDGVGAIRTQGVLRLAGVQQAAVGRPQLGLDDLPHRLAASLEGREGNGRGSPEAGPGLDAHPRLGDDAQRPFAAQHQAVGAGARAAAGQASGLPYPLGGNHPHGLYEVVDVGLVGGVVAAGAGGNPPAQG